MKKTLLSALLLSAAVHLSAQTVIFEENFNGNYPNYNLPADWESVDRDGNNTKWTTDNYPIYNDMGFSGGVVVLQTFPVSDDVFISPGINLEAGYTYSLTFLAGLYNGFEITAGTNHYGVYVLPEGDSFTGTETPVFEETISSRNIAESRTVDLSAYSGQAVKLYFRYFNSTSRNNIIAIDDISVTQSPMLGTSEVKQGNTVGIYPNPASDYVYLKSKSKITNAEVYDMAGRKMNIKAENEKLDVRGLQPGTYIITTESENKKSSQKFIKK